MTVTLESCVMTFSTVRACFWQGGSGFGVQGSGFRFRRYLQVLNPEP